MKNREGRNTIYSAESFHFNLLKYDFQKKAILLEVKQGSGKNPGVNIDVPMRTLKPSNNKLERYGSRLG